MEDRGAAGYKGSEHGTAGSKPKYDGGPAFPFPEMHSNSAPTGMSLRDYLAAKAMQGALSAAAGESFADSLRQRSLMEGKGIAEVLAMDAYITADAMLAERAK